MTNIRKNSLNNKRKADIIVANDLRRKIICTTQKLTSSISSNTVDKDLSIDEKVCDLEFSKKDNFSFAVAECS
jgi:hypothetical protein